LHERVVTLRFEKRFVVDAPRLMRRGVKLADLFLKVTDRRFEVGFAVRLGCVRFDSPVLGGRCLFSLFGGSGEIGEIDRSGARGAGEKSRLVTAAGASLVVSVSTFACSWSF